MNHHSQDLRKAFSKFATGVTVITTLDQSGEPLGATVNSFTSVSLNPPLVLWCLGDQVWGLEGFLAAENLAVNVLSDSQQPVSDIFATQGNFNRFESTGFIKGANGAPLLENCCANLECSRHDQQRIGDHWVQICAVERVRVDDERPLLYFDSAYQRLK